MTGSLPTDLALLSSGVLLSTSRPDLAHQSVPLLAHVMPHQPRESQP